jgi:hypothetical protein
MWSPLRSYAIIAAAEHRIRDSGCVIQRVIRCRVDTTERLILASQRRITETLSIVLNLAAIADGLPSLHLAG